MNHKGVHMKKLTISILAIVVLIGIDQVTKKIAENLLAGKGEVNVLNDYIILILARNRGGFLSFGKGVNDIIWMILFIIIPLIVLVGLSFYILSKQKGNTFYLTVWVLVLSGGLGNIIDRILYGSVIDFMNIGIGSLRTGIFNVADLYIVFFAAYIIIKYLVCLKKKESFFDLL